MSDEKVMPLTPDDPDVLDHDLAVALRALSELERLHLDLVDRMGAYALALSRCRCGAAAQMDLPEE